MHGALVELAKRLGTEPPEWSESAARSGRAWLTANNTVVPKRLGRSAQPPQSGPRRGMAGLPGKSG